MYIPPAFHIDDRAELFAVLRGARLLNFVTATAEGLMATALPMLLDENEGEHGTFYGHVARANPQWQVAPVAEAIVIAMGPDAYVSPSWYATKHETGKVVPTWNYVSVHAYGPVEFFEDAARLLDVLTRLTNAHEGQRPRPWAVSDAPPAYIHSQLRGIVGVRMQITRIEGKRKMSQNRPVQDRQGVAAGLAESDSAMDRHVATLIPR